MIPKSSQPIIGSTESPRPPVGPNIEYRGFSIQNSHFATYGANGVLIPLSEGLVRYLVKSTVVGHKDVSQESNSDESQNGSSKQSLQRSSASISMSRLVIVGDIETFGRFPGTIEIYQNVNRQQPYSEIYRPKQSLHDLHQFFPSMGRHLFNAIELRNSAFCYLAFPVAHLDHLGMYLQSDLIFAGAFQSISDALRDCFGQQHLYLRLTAYLGAVRNWNAFPSIDQLTFKGSIGNMSSTLFDVLTFTRVGVELLLDANTDLSKGTTKWRFGYGFFGDVNLSIPNSDLPLKCQYHIRKLSSTYFLSLTLRDDEWRGVFGIEGLDLSCVYFEGVIDPGGDKNHFELKVEAEMKWYPITIAVGGSYGSNGFSINAYIGDVSFHDVGQLFQQIMGAELGTFDHQVMLNSMYLEISSHGLFLSGRVTIDGHLSPAGKLELNRDGISISGSVEDVAFKGIKIRKAKLDVFISTKSQKRSTRETTFAIVGDVRFQGVRLQVGLYIRNPGDCKPMEWTLYGEVEGVLSTSKLWPDLKGTFLDISLTHVALMAANHGNNNDSSNTHGYTTVNGVQFCATVNSIPALDKLVGGSIEGTILTAAYSKKAFSLSLVLPSNRTITFSPGVYTGPISMRIQTGRNIKLVGEMNLYVDRPRQSQPLNFALALMVGPTGASASGHMLTDWVSPCGVGDGIIIRDCAVEIGILYATFFTKGTLEKLGIAGQIMIGQKEATVAASLGHNPLEQLLKASVIDLGVVDLVKFASQITGVDLPPPDYGCLHFDHFDLYLSTGATVGIKYYLPGATLNGDMHIFGKKAQFDCRLQHGGTHLRMMATIEAFSIGPLKITGAKDLNPSVDIELSSTIQKVYIDGAATIWGFYTAIHLEAMLQPSPKCDLSFEYRLCNLFSVRFHANLTKSFNFMNLESLEDVNFEVHAKLEPSEIRKLIDGSSAVLQLPLLGPEALRSSMPVGLGYLIMMRFLGFAVAAWASKNCSKPSNFKSIELTSSSKSLTDNGPRIQVLTHVVFCGEEIEFAVEWQRSFGLVEFNKALSYELSETIRARFLAMQKETYHQPQESYMSRFNKTMGEILNTDVYSMGLLSVWDTRSRSRILEELALDMDI